jgi:hypothetical protein
MVAGDAACACGENGDASSTLAEAGVQGWHAPEKRR